MKPAPEWSDWMAEWRRWSDAEHEGIVARDWQRVSACQRAKAELQERAPTWRITERHATLPDPGRAIDDLIALERRNALELQRVRAALEVERRDLVGVERTLRRVGASYGGLHAVSWQAYS